jgi:hypothetical protein
LTSQQTEPGADQNKIISGLCLFFTLLHLKKQAGEDIYMFICAAGACIQNVRSDNNW